MYEWKQELYICVWRGWQKLPGCVDFCLFLKKIKIFQNYFIKKSLKNLSKSPLALNHSKYIFFHKLIQDIYDEFHTSLRFESPLCREWEDTCMNEIIMLRKIQSNDFHENSMIYIYLLYVLPPLVHSFLVIFAMARC